MKLQLTSADGYHGFKGLKEEVKRRKEKESRKACSSLSREVGSGYSVNDLLKDGSRRRTVAIVTYIAKTVVLTADSSRVSSRAA